MQNSMSHFEWLGFETRNGAELGFAAEQRKGLLGALFRNLFGHWRRFEIHVFNPARELVLVVHHPFRFFFQGMEVRTPDGQIIGAMQRLGLKSRA